MSKSLSDTTILGEYPDALSLQLRSRIPTQPSDVKLTKVETLRLAMSYIMHLEKLVGDIKAQEKESTGSSEVSSTSEIKSSRVCVSVLYSSF